MSRQMKISLSGTDLHITADLLDDVNRQACDVLWGNLPYRSVLLHTVVAGSNMHSFVPTTAPFYDHAPTLRRRLECEPGTIFSPYPRCLFVKYGPDSEDHQFPPVARVTEDSLPAMREMGRLSWQAVYHSKEIRQIVVERAGQPSGAVPSVSSRLPSADRFGEPDLRQLAADMTAAIDDMWLTPPAELTDLYSGDHSARTGLGSYGQYFSTLFFVEGEISRLSNIANIGSIDIMLRLCRSGELPLPALKTATSMLCDVSVRYLAMCGQQTISDFFQRLVRHFDAITTPEEYFDLFSLFSLYAYRLHSWNMLLFPWKAGQETHAYQPPAPAGAASR
ncbi:hypothetical protein RVR_10219 [Actinacidiphila reveromycinica]|uniref:Cucumopine synthase C-terminal helical bundle domain-containing protein n=1 Tax=Actinacidiphila reveromycinica TaxID=659352 RepID=A0A7U3VSU5_9ACTN|nr:hypothetical protein [Streptomyces sp. SN-593]BBB02328.1 hypothetical protein RVR_10219 [Streptomyces sp. SN-593]